MSDKAIETLQALARRVREAGDAVTAQKALAQAEAIAKDESLAPSRRLGVAVEDVAAALIPWGPGPAVQGLFDQAQKVLKAASDVDIDDWLVLWHNLSAFYDGYGVPQGCDEFMNHIAKVADSWGGPLHAMGAGVLVEEALAHRKSDRIAPMQACLRQAHRFFNGDEQPAAARASWLMRYAQLLTGAGCHEGVDSLLAQAVDLAHSQGHAQLEAEALLCRAAAAEARGDLPTVAASLDRAQASVSQPPLADTVLAAAVAVNRVGLTLSQRDAAHYADAREECSHAIDLLRKLGRADSPEFAYALFYSAQLCERLGDRSRAAQDYRAAAAVQGAEPANVADWLSLAGDAWFEEGRFDSASECYLDAVRRRVVIPAP